VIHSLSLFFGVYSVLKSQLRIITNLNNGSVIKRYNKDRLISSSFDPINGIFLVFGDKNLKGLGAGLDSPQAFHDTPGMGAESCPWFALGCQHEKLVRQNFVFMFGQKRQLKLQKMRFMFIFLPNQCVHP